MTPTILYFRCINPKAGHGLVLGEVYPGWRNAAGETEIALAESSHLTYERGESTEKDFDSATAEEFEASIQAAMKGVDGLAAEQAAFGRELQAFNTNLLGAGDVACPGAETHTLATFQSAGQVRNLAHGLKRKATTLAQCVKDKKAYLDAKLGQKMALAMASLADMQAVVEKLTEVVYTVQLYLGRDEEVVCLRDGEPAAANVPVSIRQNVLAMDEEVALTYPHGIDCDEIELFDKWLKASPENLKQVIPEEKGVVCLRVRRSDKDYMPETIGEFLAAAEKNHANAMSYWLIKSGQRLHRIWANISVGERLLPNSDEVDHFFFERKRTHDGATSEVPHRPGSRRFMEAMDQADKVRRHYMRLMLVLQGLVDRTMLLAPFPEAGRPNLLDPDSWAGRVNFIRDVEGTLTDGRPTFSEWLAKVNNGLQHGHRIVGSFPVSHCRDERSRVHPANADGVNDDDVHVVEEHAGELRFLFKRTDTVYRRGSYFRREDSGPAKTSGSYRIHRYDNFFVCIDHATIADMEYYLKDRRHRTDYEYMVPALKKAIEVKNAEALAERPFRELLLAKLTEATPKNPATEDQVSRLIMWWKTKTREHRALLADDAKAYRMILARHKEQAKSPLKESDVSAFKDALIRIPDALLAFHVGGREFGVLRPGGFTPAYLTEERWTVTDGTAHRIGTEEHILAQKAHYEAYTVIQGSPRWDERKPIFSPAKHPSPAHFKALVEWVKANPREDAGKTDLPVAIYVDYDDLRTKIVAASFDISEDAASRRRGWGSLDEPKNLLDGVDMPFGHESIVTISGKGAPVFSYKWNGGSRTCIDHDDRIQKGWVKSRHWGDSVHILWLSEANLKKVANVLPIRKAHNTRVGNLEQWVRDMDAAAAATLKQAWRTKQYALYIAQGGNTEFFDDHLTTLPEFECDTDFIGAILTRALNAGASKKKLVGMTLPEIIRVFPEKLDEDEDPTELPKDELAGLIAQGWTPKAKGKSDGD